MDVKDIEFGKIMMWDALSNSGVIQAKPDGKIFFFQLNDIEMGVPQEGEDVQFVKDMSAKSATARKVNVLSSAARKGWQSYK